MPSSLLFGLYCHNSSDFVLFLAGISDTQFCLCTHVFDSSQSPPCVLFWPFREQTYKHSNKSEIYICITVNSELCNFILEHTEKLVWKKKWWEDKNENYKEKITDINAFIINIQIRNKK